MTEQLPNNISVMEAEQAEAVNELFSTATEQENIPLSDPNIKPEISTEFVDSLQQSTTYEKIAQDFRAEGPENTKFSAAATVNFGRSYVVWCAAIIIYIIAVAGRLSFSMVSIEAVSRYSLSASSISLFAVIQVGVYGISQVPIGILLDRFGSKKVLLSGAIVMALGQLLIGIATDLPVALLARILIGFGDATAYLSVIRITPFWFPPRQAPMLNQITSVTGSAGQVIAAVPFVWVMETSGWFAAFGSIAMGGFVAILIGLALVKDFPGQERYIALQNYVKKRQKRGGPIVFDWKFEQMRNRSPWREPGVWIGFFAHVLGCTFPIVFTLMWGVPLLKLGFGLNNIQVSVIMLILTLSNIGTSLIVGSFTMAHPLRRSWAVLFSFTISMLSFAWVLYGAKPTMVSMVIFCICLSISGSASVVGFDFARTSVQAKRLGIASGIVNAAGFLVALIIMMLMGVVLDLTSVNGQYVLSSFRYAYIVQFICLGVCALLFLYFRRKTRRDMAMRGIIVPPVKGAIIRTIANSSLKNRWISKN